MKRHILITTLLLSCVQAAAADLPVAPAEAGAPATMDLPWQTIFNTDTRYFTVRGTRGFPAPNNGSFNALGKGSGSELYIPFGISTTGYLGQELKLEMVARGGYVYSRQDTFGLSGTYSGLVDTTVSTTLTYLGLQTFQPFMSVNMNLPTGESYLTGNRNFSKLDPDIVDVGAYGQGFNIGPTAGTNISLDEHNTVSLSGGYTYLGNFNVFGPNYSINNMQFNNAGLASTAAPQDNVQGTTTNVGLGSNTSFSASWGYRDNSITNQFSATYSLFNTTRIDNIPVTRGGNLFALQNSFSILLGERLLSTLSGSFAHVQNNFLLDPVTSSLQIQRPNANSNLYRTGLDILYTFDPRLSAGPSASFLYRDRNAFDPFTAEFIPAKTRWSVGVVGQVNITDSTSLNFRIERAYIHEDAKLDQVLNLGGILFPVPGSGTVRLNSQSWLISGGVGAKF